MKRAIIGAVALFLTLTGVSAWADTTAEGKSLLGKRTAAVTYGPYFRGAIGYEFNKTRSGDWIPPGPSDPQVFFDIDARDAAYGALGLGYDWMNGFRADVSLSRFATKGASGPWSYTVPTVAGPHASVDTRYSSTAMLGTLYYSPLQHQGNNSRFQPYVLVGAGLSANKMKSWTRTNAAAVQPVRSFESGSKTDFAWTLGLGASWQMQKQGKRPIILDVTYQYFDLGEAAGGSSPLPGSGTSVPRRPLHLDLETSVLSVGIRIPLERR